ncbi:MAG: hypothetical protein QXR06_03855 [Candidatus Bathyarchaeia archaeon]|nr:hypothetical protein [Candidatus Bathyarchaeota archaeon]
MATILIKNVPEDLLKELKRLKVELGCRTWAELLAKMVRSERVILLREDDFKRMRDGVQNFLGLRGIVSERWREGPNALIELRGSRRHKKA